MKFEDFVESVKQAGFYIAKYTPEARTEMLTEIWRDTNKSIEGAGDENATQDDWWECAMEVLPDYFEFVGTE